MLASAELCWSEYKKIPGIVSPQTPMAKAQTSSLKLKTSNLEVINSGHPSARSSA